MNITSEFYYFLIIIIGIIFHLLFGYSMFDIFFKFPLNYGMIPHSSNLTNEETPSKRVVLIILDGVRTDTIYEVISSGKTSFLRDIVTKRGVYGISHTKVPTETKPGFTAICSGHFEDASLALKELYNKHVTLDSVFNQSKYSWAIGHDACMFTGVAKQMECIPENSTENFNNLNPEKQDYILFDILIKKMRYSKYKKEGELYQKLNSSKITFLIHLLQADPLGHAHGPKSDKVKNYLIILDSYFEKLFKFFNEFYEDNKTTFIITGDHGMDMRRAHGDGHPDCTRTPFIIWGSGIREAIYIGKKQENEDAQKKFNLDDYKRKDIEQIDFTPLIAGLLGINYPMNSLGIIPLDIFNVSDKIKSKLLYGNMLELFDIYKIKNEYESKAVFYKTFKPLINSSILMENITNNIDKGNYYQAINDTNILIKLILEGIDYILHYDRQYLKTIVSFGYISWMVYLLIFFKMKNEKVLNKFFFYNSKDKIVNIIIIFIIVSLYLFLFLRLRPFIYYIYTLFPCYFLWRIIANIKYLKLFFIFSNDIKKVLINFILYITTVFAFLSIVSNKQYNYYRQ